MVDLRRRKREMRGDRENQNEKLDLRRISCESQFTVPYTVVDNPDLVCNYTDMRSPKPNQASRIPDF